MIHWNAPEWAASACRSILESTGIKPIITVIDNLSPQTKKLSSVLPSNIRVIYVSHNGGFTSAANLALQDWVDRMDSTEFCMICAHDLHVKPNAIGEMLTQLHLNPEYGIVNPTIWQHEPKGHYRDPMPLKTTEWASGACLMLRRQSVQDVRFDERFGSYCEDVDFCLAVSDRGWKIGLATRAVAWELGSVSSRAGIMVKANTIRLQVKRAGILSGIWALVILMTGGIRALISSIMLWRKRQKRRDSFKQFNESMRAILTVLNPKFWL